ncbi:MAG: GNAT family N-acetyltransferase [Woeseiaceae bacterium]
MSQLDKRTIDTGETCGIAETQRLLLRRLTPDDADLMLAIWTDPAFVRHVGDRGIRTIAQARRALGDSVLTLYETYGYGPYCMVRKDDAQRIGICGLFRRETLLHPDIGFALLPTFCGVGFALEAARAVVRHAREDLGIKTLDAIVSPLNKASVSLLEKLGLKFQRSITMPGETEEIGLYSINLS